MKTNLNKFLKDVHIRKYQDSAYVSCEIHAKTVDMPLFVEKSNPFEATCSKCIELYHVSK